MSVSSRLYNLLSLSCRKHSLMYQSQSMITVPDPLSATLIIMSVRRCSCLRASRSGVVRFSRTDLGVRLRMSRASHLRDEATREPSRSAKLLRTGVLPEPVQSCIGRFNSAA